MAVLLDKFEQTTRHDNVRETEEVKPPLAVEDKTARSSFHVFLNVTQDQLVFVNGM